MKVEIKAPFSNLYSRINLSKTNKLIDMNDWEKQSVEQAKVKLYPTLHTKAPVLQAIDNLEKMQEAFSRAAKRASAKKLASEEGQEIITKAEKYHIEYDKDDINWFKLMHEIEDYEILLNEAKAHNIIWDYRFYDPIGLKQEIENDISQEKRYSYEERSDYLHSRL